MARVLILRPAEDAAATADALAARGHTPQVLPAEAIVALRPPLPEEPFAALIVTSAHAVPALAAEPSCPWPEILAVGERTASALRAAGFDKVTVGGGGAAALVAPAARLAAAQGLPILYAAGRVRTDTMETALAAQQVRLCVWEVYDIRPLDPDPEAIARATQGAAPEAVLLLSRGQVDAYLRLSHRLPQLPGAPPRLLCLSRRIAEALPPHLRSSAEISPAMSLATLFDHVL